MPEIRGLLDAGPPAPCVWCGEPTGNRAETPGRPDLGAVPLDVFCAGAIIVAYRKAREGRLLPAGVARLVAFERTLAQIGAGRPDEVRIAEGDFDLRREIESRNRAFAGEPYAVRDPEPE